MKKCKSIFLIDDSIMDNFANSKLIEKLGITESLKVFENGLEAINYFNILNEIDQAPDLVFLDLNMPIMNGFDFLSNFNLLPLKDKQNIKIIILSSSASPVDKQKANMLGCEEYIVKPLTTEKILEVYEKVVSMTNEQS